MVRSVIALALAVVVCSTSFAGPFGLFGKRTVNNNQLQSTQQTTTTTYYQGGYGELGSAQGVANRMARLLTCRHFGGGPYNFEGVGMASTAQGAIANTCKPRFGGPPRETGVCQGANGMWFACNRW